MKAAATKRRRVMVKSKGSAIFGFAVAWLLFCSLLISGCSSEGRPTARLANADLAIQEAREANAINYAPLQLRLAEDKLKQARAAAAKENNKEARSLAEEAFADARTAEAQSRSEKAADRAANEGKCGRLTERAFRTVSIRE
jgi:hypothetical protein